jgi:hypothetical protein
MPALKYCEVYLPRFNVYLGFSTPQQRANFHRHRHLVDKCSTLEEVRAFLKTVPEANCMMYEKATALTTPRFVILRSIGTGERFYTTNSDDATRLATGEVAYEILGYAHTNEQAQAFLGHLGNPAFWVI